VNSDIKKKKFSSTTGVLFAVLFSAAFSRHDLNLLALTRR